MYRLENLIFGFNSINKLKNIYMYGEIARDMIVDKHL